MWHDMRNEARAWATQDSLKEWDDFWVSPLDTGRVDDEVLQQLVDTGQAVDLVDAADWYQHYMSMAGVDDPVKKAAAAADFAARRKARLAAGGAATA